MFGAAEEGAAEAAANFKTLRGGQRQHRLGEIGFEAVEDRFAEADRQAPHAAFDDAADRVAFAAHRLDAFDHGGGGCGIRAAHGRRLDRFEGGEIHRCRGRHYNIVNARDVGAYLDRPGGGTAGVRRGGGEDFLGQCAGRDPPDGLAGGAATAAVRIADAELGIVGEVRVRGAVGQLHLGVGGGALVGVAHEQGNRRAGGAAFEDAGKDLDGIGLLARRGDVTLAWAPAVELGLDFSGGYWQARRAAVDDNADGGTVAFAPGGDAENMAKTVGH